MRNYQVKTGEVHYAIWSVEADSEEEAKEKAIRGEGWCESREYSHEYDDPYVLPPLESQKILGCPESVGGA
jgi:hypothetical protein